MKPNEREICNQMISDKALAEYLEREYGITGIQVSERDRYQPATDQRGVESEATPRQGIRERVNLSTLFIAVFVIFLVLMAGMVAKCNGASLNQLPNWTGEYLPNGQVQYHTVFLPGSDTRENHAPIITLIDTHSSYQESNPDLNRPLMIVRPDVPNNPGPCVINCSPLIPNDPVVPNDPVIPGTPVPEPSTKGLFVIACIATGAYWLRRVLA